MKFLLFSALLSALFLPSGSAQATDACAQAIQNETALPELASSFEGGKNIYDVHGRASRLAKSLGYLNESTYYSCVAKKTGKQYCVEQQVDRWQVHHQAWIFKTSFNEDKVKLESHIATDPSSASIYRKKSLDNKLQVMIDRHTLQFISLYTHNDESAFGVIPKYDSDTGLCVKTDFSKITADLDRLLTKNLFNALAGKDPAHLHLTDANFLLDPSNDHLYQITRLFQDTLKAEVLDLTSGKKVKSTFDELSNLKVVDAASIKNELQNSPLSAALLSEASAKSWNCIQSVSNQHDIAYHGFTTLSLEPADATAQGSDLSLKMIAKASILSQGWSGGTSPALFPNGKKVIRLVSNLNGASFFLLSHGNESLPLQGVDAKSAQAKFGLSANLMSFGNMLCFNHTL